MDFAYFCPNCGPFDSTICGDRIDCRCGASAKRSYQISVNRSSLRTQARWDPVVGEYVENDRQFRTLLRQGQEAQEKRPKMDVKVATVDARDTEAVAELHGYTTDQREQDLEPVKKAEWEKARA